MNSHKRVCKALNQENTDRVPVDFGGTIVSSITKGAYNKLKNYKGLVGEAELIDIVQGLVEPPENLKEEYNCDFKRISLNPADSWELKIEENKFEDEFGIVRRKAGPYYDIVGFPLKDADLADLEKYDWPDPGDPGRTRGLSQKARTISQETDYVIIADMISGGLFEQALRMRGYEKFFLDLGLNKKFAHALLDKLLEVYLGLYEHYIEAVGDYVTIFALADDLGTQQNLMISPAMYREFIKPRHKILYNYIKEKSDGAYIFHHSCGAIFPLIGDLIDVGVDIIQSVQTSAKGMNISRLAKEYGGDISFFGAIDVQQDLPNKSPAEITEIVLKTIEVLGKNGGYILSPSHNIQADTPPENVEALFKAI